MIILKNVLLGVSICLFAITGYSQSIVGSRTIRHVHEVYNGSDVIKSLSKEKRDTTFVRYFDGGFIVDSTKQWSELVKYTGNSLSNDQYLFRTKGYKVNNTNGNVDLVYESSRTLLDKKGKKSTYQLNKLLQDGLVEVYINNKGDKSTKCIDKDGTIVNTKGCLLYTTSRFPLEKMKDMSAKIKDNIIYTMMISKGGVPNYILVNLETDYFTKKWFVVFNFPKDYTINNTLYSELVLAILNVLNKEKLQDYHFNKDVNGHYYNYSLRLPIVFHG